MQFDILLSQAYNIHHNMKSMTFYVKLCEVFMAKQVKVKTVSNLSNNSFLGLLFIVLGIFFLMGADTTLKILFTILGAILIVLGATELFDMNWIVGAIELALGIIIIVCGNLILEYMLIILAIVVLAYAIYLLVSFFVKNPKAGASKIILSLIAPLLLITIGILLILQYCGIADLFIVVGAISVAIGAFLVFYDLIKKLVSKSK